MNPEAVAAFDKVPFTSGSAVFTHDTSTDIFTLHDSLAMPVGGGKLTGSGQMWVAPVAEKDPQAIAMQIEGYGINTKEVMKSYLSEVGSTNVKNSRMNGCLLSKWPIVRFRSLVRLVQTPH